MPSTNCWKTTNAGSSSGLLRRSGARLSARSVDHTDRQTRRGKTCRRATASSPGTGTLANTNARNARSNRASTALIDAVRRRLSPSARGSVSGGCCAKTVAVVLSAAGMATVTATVRVVVSRRCVSFFIASSSRRCAVRLAPVRRNADFRPCRAEARCTAPPAAIRQTIPAVAVSAVDQLKDTIGIVLARGRVVLAAQLAGALDRAIQRSRRTAVIGHRMVKPWLLERVGRVLRVLVVRQPPRRIHLDAAALIIDFYEEVMAETGCAARRVTRGTLRRAVTLAGGHRYRAFCFPIWAATHALVSTPVEMPAHALEGWRVNDIEEPPAGDTFQSDRTETI